MGDNAIHYFRCSCPGSMSFDIGAPYLPAFEIIGPLSKRVFNPNIQIWLPLQFAPGTIIPVCPSSPCRSGAAFLYVKITLRIHFFFKRTNLASPQIDAKGRYPSLLSLDPGLHLRFVQILLKADLFGVKLFL